ncbi:hypothetical protein COY95_00045 [Candidatus Woesearchaeota archaeon CG_4_10_14_0_8_um_filter_47_5]|nr:MAG: hypothetical protein COY95_00045 [Candidatus Woesearchaeota archaeon CG_4_10_14_0_8_um_filter_47_5]
MAQKNQTLEWICASVGCLGSGLSARTPHQFVVEERDAEYPPGERIIVEATPAGALSEEERRRVSAQVVNRGTTIAWTDLSPLVGLGVMNLGMAIPGLDLAINMEIFDGSQSKTYPLTLVVGDEKLSVPLNEQGRMGNGAQFLQFLTKEGLNRHSEGIIDAALNYFYNHISRLLV